MNGAPPPASLELERFLRQYGKLITKWIQRAVQAQPASAADIEDLRAMARAAAWEGYQRWLALPEGQRSARQRNAIVARSIKDAILKGWLELNPNAPRRTRDRGGGQRAAMLRDYLEHLHEQLGDAYAQQRVDLAANLIVSYQLVMHGLLHGSTGLVSAEEEALRDEARERLSFALEALQGEERILIRGHYFEGRTFEELGRELRRSRSAMSRLHIKALESLREQMEEFASLLTGRYVGQTLDPSPSPRR